MNFSLDFENVKDILIFGSALWSQTESTINTIRNHSNANIHIFFRDEDINNLDLKDIKGVSYTPYRLDLGSFLKIRKTRPQLVIILCDNVYNIGYRKAKLFSLLSGADTVLFSNILNETKPYGLKELWKDRTKHIRNLLTISMDLIIAPVFFILFSGTVRVIGLFYKKDEDSVM